MARIALLFAIAVIWLLSTPARAAPHQVCLYLDIGALLWDASPRHADGRDFHEEYGRNDGPTSYPAQRWLARVSDQSTGENFFGWKPLDGSGCAAFELGGSTNLRIEWARWAVWEETGNQLVGYDCEVTRLRTARSATPSRRWHRRTTASPVSSSSQTKNLQGHEPTSSCG